MQTPDSPDHCLWLFSRRADFWLACGGASLGLLAAVALIFLHGDREVDALDFVLSELHLGATYGAVIQRRLWRDRRIDVLLLPLVIIALTYALSLTGQTILLTSIAMYAAVWHRGRQSLGVARFYQRVIGGPVSPAHNILFRGAIYLPMLAAMLAYTHLAPAQYEGEPYLALRFGAGFAGLAGVTAVVWVLAYLAWVVSRTRSVWPASASVLDGSVIHPGEWWVVVAHAVAFGTAYVLGAANAAFILVLAVYHEVQYLYFTYAMKQRPARYNKVEESGGEPSKSPGMKASRLSDLELHQDLKSVASFLVWPVIGFVSAVIGGWLQLNWLAPLGLGGLFCHYWLDGRIWVRRPG